jgi:hypothetical protein
MTEERRKLARELLEKATPRPWTYDKDWTWDIYGGPAGQRISAAVDGADAVLIANAPSLLAEALDALEAAEREVARLRRRIWPNGEGG